MFDLEQAIKKWKRGLAANQAMEEGYIAELEGHLHDRVEELTRQGVAAQDAFRQVTAAMGKTEQIGAEFYKTHTVRQSGRPPWQPPRFIPALVWNYLKVANRLLKRQMEFYLTNLLGLSLGLASCLLILCYIRYELSYDRYHQNANAIYRVVCGGDSKSPGSAITPGALQQAAEVLPEVIRSARIMPEPKLISRNGQFFREDKFFFADPEFLEMFSFPLLAGDPRRALQDSFAIVLTDTTAKKYFGQENPIGKSLKIGEAFDSEQYEFKISGIVADPPKNSHFMFDFLASMQTLARITKKNNLASWSNCSYITYLQLAKGAAPSGLVRKLNALLRKHAPKRAGQNSSKLIPWEFKLQALTDIHLGGTLDAEIETNGDVRFITIFATIGAFILVVACLNYMNLATAMSFLRTKEIGLRKVMGAGRPDLIRQYLAESMLMAWLSLAVALIITRLACPFFGNLMSRELDYWFLFQPVNLAILMVLTFLVGLFAGSYPAFFLSAPQPLQIFQKAAFHTQGRTLGLRRSLVLIQFVISITLVACALTVYNQLHFIKKKDLGFAQNQIVTVAVLDPNLWQKAGSLNSELSKHPKVRQIAWSSDLPQPKEPPQTSWATWEGQTDNDRLLVYSMGIDDRFLTLYGIKMISGREFSRDFPGDRKKALIINQALAEALGWDAPIGKALDITPFDGLGKGTVIGVVGNFHFFPLWKGIEPLAFYFTGTSEAPQQGANWLSLKIGTDDASETLEYIERTIKKFSPAFPYEYSFFDERIAAVYRTEQRLAQTIGYFTAIAMLITCLGLFGLVTFALHQRIREIGIRRVLGASILEVFLLLNKEFSLVVMAANLLAWPLAYYFMSRWLHNFAYRIVLSPGLFVLAGMLALAAALLTISWQTWQVARANPADTLRYE